MSEYIRTSLGTLEQIQVGFATVQYPTSSTNYCCGSSNRASKREILKIAESNPNWSSPINDPYAADGATSRFAHRTLGTHELVVCTFMVNNCNSEFELNNPAS